MILGFDVENFDLFDKDQCGVLMEDIGNADKADLYPMAGLGAFIGRNQTGKSSFMDAIYFLKHCVTKGVRTASTSKDRPGFSKLIIDRKKPAVFRVYMKLKAPKDDANGLRRHFVQYELELGTNRHGIPVVRSERAYLHAKQETVIPVLEIDNQKGRVLTKLSADYQSEYEKTHISDDHTCALQLYGRISSYGILHEIYHEISRWFFCCFSSGDESNYFEVGNAPGGHKHLNNAGTNVRNVLEYIKGEDEAYYETLVADLSAKIPEMKKKRLPEKLADSPNKLFLYLLLLADKDPASTIFIETPDRDLYHDMIDVLASRMREYSFERPYNQILFTTHNPYILESISPKEVWVFKRSFEQEKGDITIECAGKDKLVNEMFKQGVGMGAIWYGGHLE